MMVGLQQRGEGLAGQQLADQAGTNRSRMVRAERRLMRRSDKSGRISVATAGKKGIISDITCGQHKHNHPIVSDRKCCQT